ncbi:MAG TPA: hypothetical protein VFT28_03165, partial [Gemmatimonadales bacterium]|nr:hypothetical protein [Gemmatimonadales bacterium]
MTAGWDRVEGMIRGEDLTGGLQARIADPLWMLAQQRRVGEFVGDDAAEPVGVRLRARVAPLTCFEGGEFPRYPLEMVVEATAEPDLGSAGVFASARAARRLVHLLRERGLAGAVEMLRERFPLRVEGAGEAGSLPVLALLGRWGFDAVAVRESSDLDTDADVRAVIDQWRSWWAASSPRRDSPSWSDERMEYSCSFGVDDAVTLSVPEHCGGPLDWFSCDLASDSGLEEGTGETLNVTLLPAPVRYLGMPASRWFEFEDGDVNFGDIDAGPADLARLLVAEFATVYGDDWYLVPLRVPAGCLAEVLKVQVLDAFGDLADVKSVARNDFERVGPARPWRMFELSGDEVGPGHPSPWLFVPPSLGSSLEGPVLERVAFTRDEGANLAWGVEQLIEGPLGRSVERSAVWHSRASAAAEASTSDIPVPSSGLWSYRLGGEAPPWWIPLVPQRIDPTSSAEVRLRRARLQSWSSLEPPDLVGPKSDLLDPRRPRWVYEEEVPRGGVRVERLWQAARAPDGGLHVWLRKRKRPGRGDRGSGLR